MSNVSDKLAIANNALLSIGETQIAVLDTTKPLANKINGIFEGTVKELLSEDWFFNRKRVLLSDLTAVNKLTLDASPTPAAFKIGATLTGATSSVTCTVLEVLSSTVYLVTEPTGDFTDGEIIGDGGTNTRNCETGYPQVSETLGYGGYDYGFVIPSDCLFIRGIGDVDCDNFRYPHKPEGNIILANTNDAYFHYNKWIGYQGSETVSDVTYMRGWFHRLISARIAHILAPNTTQNMREPQKAQIEWDAAYLNAREQNGYETHNEAEEESESWAEGANNEIQSI